MMYNFLTITAIWLWNELAQDIQDLANSQQVAGHEVIEAPTITNELNNAEMGLENVADDGFDTHL